MDVGAGHARKVGPQLLDVLALLADDDAGARAVDRDAGALGRTLDHHAGNAGLRALLLDECADLQVLVQEVA